MKNRVPLRMVALGGGAGCASILRGLKNRIPRLTAIVAMTDDGDSTGFFRNEFDVHSLADIRQSLVALAENELLATLFQYRFERGALFGGQVVGNVLLTALVKQSKNLEDAISVAERVLACAGRVIPVTLSRSVNLCARLQNGLHIRGATNIDSSKVTKGEWAPIQKLWLAPPAPLNPRARKAIQDADYIALGPGDLYTTLAPNLMVSGMQSALRKTHAKIIYFVNLVTKYSETNGFTASRFVEALETYVPRIDYVVMNTKRFQVASLPVYRKKRSHFVEPDLPTHTGTGHPAVIAAPLLQIVNGFIRHDPEKIFRVIEKIAALN